MKKYTAGFIGAGNMGGAIAKKLCDSVGAENIIVACSTKESSLQAANYIGCDYGSANDVAEKSRFVFLGIKPQVAESVVCDISDSFGDDVIVVSMLAGKTISFIRDITKCEKVIRIMPNTPVSVGEGMTQISVSEAITEQEAKEFCEIMASTGKCDIVPEAFIDAACALSGCGPAFVYMFIEALSDGAVKCGLPREKATEYAAQTLLGASKLLLESNKSTSELKNSVCSPGGSTIAGVSSLESDGFRAAAINAVCASYKRTKELGK